ncbi:MAG: S-methyl-5-thioribose-1-phosphate isomerase [bacterium]|nr:S-methyl-5-thioribose-1-phosphate isomerase [bacterium]
MPFDTIAVDHGQVKIIDQTRLPTETVYLTIESAEQMWEAIKMLRVRGAPAIGVSAAFGVYVGVKNSQAADSASFLEEVNRVADYLATSRPTAVNLFWALDRIKRVASDHKDRPPEELKKVIFDEAVRMLEEDAAVCRAIGEHGAKLFNHGDGLLTHCNAGGLATARYGTALAPMFVAKEQGVVFNVYSDETRPLLQGSRLTAWELQQAGIPVTVICDNMAASVMSQGKIQAVIVGTDRVAANGDVANKIGTYGVAVLAKAHKIPFYVALPTSTIDLSLSDGSKIPIEERDPGEIINGFGRQTGPDGVNVYNPAFDVTPNEYVTAFITEKGIVYPPYKENLKALFD